LPSSCCTVHRSLLMPGTLSAITRTATSRPTTPLVRVMEALVVQKIGYACRMACAFPRRDTMSATHVRIRAGSMQDALKCAIVVSHRLRSGRETSNLKKRAVRCTGTKTSSSALTMMKTHGTAMPIPRDPSRTAVQKRQHTSSQQSSALPSITSRSSHPPKLYPQ